MECEGLDDDRLAVAAEALIDAERLISGHLIEDDDHDSIRDSLNFEIMLRLSRAAVKLDFTALSIECMQLFLAQWQGLAASKDGAGQACSPAMCRWPGYRFLMLWKTPPRLLRVTADLFCLSGIRETGTILAIRVIGRWYEATGSKHETQIGWVTRDAAVRIAEQAEAAPIYGVLTTLFKPDEGKNPGIRFGIWV